MMKRLISSAAVLVFLAGCATTGPHMSEIKDKIPPLDPNQGRIFFYRDASAFGVAVTADIMVDHKVVGRSVRGSSFFVDVAPGMHEIEVATELGYVTPILMAAGTTHYVESFPMPGALWGHIRAVERGVQGWLTASGELAYIGAPFDIMSSTATTSNTGGDPSNMPGIAVPKETD